MISDNQRQAQSPEEQKKRAEQGVQKPVETSEVAGKSSVPQPSPQKDDKKAVQKIQSNLQNTQAQPQTQSNPVSQNNPAQGQKTAGSDEPYIKAAENVIEKDKNDPYREEEDHEDVQVQYLKDRFGKNIKKS